MMAHHYINVFLTSASYIAGKQVRWCSRVEARCARKVCVGVALFVLQFVRLKALRRSATALPSLLSTQSSSPFTTGEAPDNTP